MFRRLAVMLVAGLPALTRARCASRAELEALGKSAGEALRCVERRLVSAAPDDACDASVAPQCAGATVDKVLDLLAADAPTPSAEARAERRCQRAMTRAARRFVVRRLLERANGSRRQQASARVFGAVARGCGVPVADTGTTLLPALRGACGDLFVPGGSAPDGQDVAHCLRPALERIVDDVAPKALRPNIVVVLTDDQRWDTLAVMPTIAAIAREGVTFDNAFVTTALCGPSRASLYSGQYAHHHGVLGNGDTLLFRDESTLPVWLSQVGYATALFGKYMNGNDEIAPRVPPGWSEWQTFVEDGGEAGGERVYYDYMLNENGVLTHHASAAADYSTDVLRDRALAYLQAHASEPLFMVYAPFAPHSPAPPAPRHAERFANLPPWRPPSWCEPDVSDKPLWVQFMAAITTPGGIAETDALRIRQLESLLAVDEAVGAIERRLERLGLADQTLVVFTSDNGLTWREHWWPAKWASYEEAIRVPLVLRYPTAVPRAVRSQVLALNIDLAPTFVEVAGATAPPDVDGRSLLGALRGETWREDFLIENSGAPVVRPSDAVRTQDAKLIRTRTDGFLELYDLAADPYELESRIGDPAWAGVQATLSARLEELLAH